MEKKLINIKQIDWFDEHWYRVRYLNDAKIEVEDYFASVTTKLGILDKPHLRKWYADLGMDEATRRMNEAGQRGTRIHYAWQVFTRGGAVIYQNYHNPAYIEKEIAEIKEGYNNDVFILHEQGEHYDFLKLVQMFNIIKPETIESEKKVFNVEHRDAGTTDNIMLIKEGHYQISGKEPLKLEGGFYILDVKTGSSVGKEAFMQVSAYAKCAESMGYATFKGALIAHTQASMRSGIDGLKVYLLSPDDIEKNYQDYRDIARVWERQGNLKPTIRQLPCLVAIGKPKEKQNEKSERTTGNENNQSGHGGVEEMPKQSMATGAGEGQSIENRTSPGSEHVEQVNGINGQMDVKKDTKRKLPTSKPGIPTSK